jgi:hypothetical protein
MTAKPASPGPNPAGLHRPRTTVGESDDRSVGGGRPSVDGVGAVTPPSSNCPGEEI